MMGRAGDPSEVADIVKCSKLRKRSGAAANSSREEVEEESHNPVKRLVVGTVLKSLSARFIDT